MKNYINKQEVRTIVLYVIISVFIIAIPHFQILNGDLKPTYLSLWYWVRVVTGFIFLFLAVSGIVVANSKNPPFNYIFSDSLASSFMFVGIISGLISVFIGPSKDMLLFRFFQVRKTYEYIKTIMSVEITNEGIQELKESFLWIDIGYYFSIIIVIGIIIFGFWVLFILILNKIKEGKYLNDARAKHISIFLKVCLAYNAYRCFNFDCIMFERFGDIMYKDVYYAFMAGIDDLKLSFDSIFDIVSKFIGLSSKMKESYDPSIGSFQYYNYFFLLCFVFVVCTLIYLSLIKEKISNHNNFLNNPPKMEYRSTKRSYH